MKYCVTKLTNQSNLNINYIFEHYPNLLEKIKDPYFIKLLYTLIYKASNTKNKYTLTTEENITVVPSKNVYFPINIREHICESIYILYTIQFIINDIIIHVKIYSNNKININKYIYFIKLVLNICVNESICSKKYFGITLYLTPLKKLKPNRVVNNDINSGFYLKTEFIIFRKEE